ncbi:hypothetical protein VTO58DRAFT_108382 [Aureobasidium pullulans]
MTAWYFRGSISFARVTASSISMAAVVCRTTFLFIDRQRIEAEKKLEDAPLAHNYYRSQTGSKEAAAVVPLPKHWMVESAASPRTKFDASSTPTFSRSTQQPSYISATTSQRHQTITMPTMLATILSSAVASLAAALRFLADGLAAIAYANNSCISTSALNTTTGNGESMPA